MSSNPVIVDEEYLQDIADAIRAKNGGSSLYTPADMATAISALSTASNFDWLDYARNGGGSMGYSNIGTQNPGKFFWYGSIYQQSVAITVGRTSSSINQFNIFVFNPHRLRVAKENNHQYVELPRILVSTVNGNQFSNVYVPTNNMSNTSNYYVAVADIDNSTVNNSAWNTLNSAIVYAGPNGSQVGTLYNQACMTLFGPDFPIQHNSTPLW